MNARTALLPTILTFILNPMTVWALDPAPRFAIPALRSIDQMHSPRVSHTAGVFNDWMGATTLKATNFALHNPYLRLKDLRPDSEMPTTNGILSSTPLLQGRFIAESEVARNNTIGDTSIRRNQSSKGMMRFSLANGAGPIRYGMSYRLAGKEFFNVPDQEWREVWGEWSAGIARLRSSMGEVTTNVDNDPTRPRMTQTMGRMMMTVARPSWPELSMSYSRSLIDNSALQSGLLSQRSVADAVEGAVSLVRSSWNARLSSSYILNTNQLQPGEDTVSYAQMFTGLFRPIEPLTITSVISYRTDVQQWTGVRTDTPVASLALNYRHSAEFMVSALGGYTGIRSSDGMTDMESVSSKGVVTWSPWGSPVHQVSFETGYTRTVLGGTSGSGQVTEDVTGLVRVQLTKF